MATLSIDPEFRDMLPALSPDERRILRESLLKESENAIPIFAWKKTDENGAHPILDGHNRYDICTNEGIPFEVRYISLPDRGACRLWILRNQLGRRNLTDAQRQLIRGRLYEELKAPEQVDRGPRGQYVTSVNAAKEIAKREGVSERTIKRDGKLAREASAVIAKAPSLREPIERGILPSTVMPALAEAPPAILKRLEGLEGTELREEARKLTQTGSDNGKQRHDPRLKQQVIDHLGKALRMIDDLNRQSADPVKHRAAIAQVKMAMSTIKGWGTSDEEGA